MHLLHSLKKIKVELKWSCAKHSYKYTSIFKKFETSYSAIHQAAGSLATGHSLYRWKNGMGERPLGPLRLVNFWNITSGNRETAESRGAGGLVNRTVKFT